MYNDIFASEDTSEETLSEEEAVAAIALVAGSTVAEDSEVDIDTFANLLWELEVFADYSEEEMSSLVDKITSIAEESSLGALYNVAYESISDELAEDAFAAAVLILMAHDGMADAGMKFLDKLRLALELEEEVAQEIIEEVLDSYSDLESADEDLESADEDSNQAVYESPSGNFTVPVPVDPRKGGLVTSQPGIVGFSDDFGTLLRIDYLQMESQKTEAQKMEETGQEAYLKNLLDNCISETILSNIPNSQVLYEEYLEDVMEGASFALVDLPQGSTLTQQINDSPPQRLDAYRGIVAFTWGDYLYFVTAQRNFFDGETPGSPEEEAEELKDKLIVFLDTVEFKP